MNWVNLKRYNFYFEFFEKGSLPFFYSFSSEFKPIYTSFDSEFKPNELLPLLAIVNCIPPYLTHLANHEKSKYACFTKAYRLGYLIDLSNSEDSIQYLKKQFKPKTYKNLRQDIQRLDKHYTITFRAFHGEIQKDYFKILIDKLEFFIGERFSQKNKSHSALSRWKRYQEPLYQMILAKKASLFVLYRDKNPIGISINYHYKETLVATVTSYDSDYYRYSIGKQMFVKQIEWCFENNYKLIDLMWGDFKHKRGFSNKIIRYETHVVFNKKSLYGKVVAFIISNALFFKYIWKEERTFSLFKKL